jgi:hypothetical protein
LTHVKPYTIIRSDLGNPFTSVPRGRMRIEPYKLRAACDTLKTLTGAATCEGK